MRTTGLLLLALVAPAVADRVVERDGTLHRGDAALREGVVCVGREKIPLAQVLLVERDDGSLVHAPDFAARLRGYDYLANKTVRREYPRLIRECCQTGDLDLARRLLEQVERAGLTTEEAVRLKLRLDRGVPGRVASERLRRRASLLNAKSLDLLLDRAERALDGGRNGPKLLREALRRGACSERARALLHRLAPEGFPLGDARTWLDWHVDLRRAGGAVVSDCPPALGQARSRWRRDLHGVRAGPILLVTPVRSSEVVGRCLAHGALCCKVLRELFATDAPARATGEPLQIYLYESRVEYLASSRVPRSLGDLLNPVDLSWSAGYYSPAEGISRFFWTADRDAERRMVRTCMHELTHHWLDEHNPRVSDAPRANGGGQSGFWIVEGFATLMMEGLYDIESGAWSLSNPRSDSLDVVQAVPAEHLIPWKRLYTLSAAEFACLPTDDMHRVILRWRLGLQGPSTGHLFYAQAAATCQFLYHAERGRYREALLRYVDDWYSGREHRLRVSLAFGLGGQDLGKRVVAYAREVIWR